MLDRFGVKGRVWAAACVVAIAVTAVANAEPILPKSGTYLSSAYVAALHKKRSHLAAVYASAAPQSVIVERDTEGNVTLHANIGFYENDNTVYDPKKPTVFTDSDNKAKKPYIWIDATHFKIGRGKSQATYSYISDATEDGGEQKFLIGALLAGTYRDARGRQYVFGTDGKAQFPDRTFRYGISTNILDAEWDQITEDSDETEDTDKTKDSDAKTSGPYPLVFAWRGKTLFLYNCIDNENIGCSADQKHPVAVLHRVR